MQLVSDDASSEEVVRDQLLDKIKRESAFISGVLNSLQNVHQYAGEDDQSEDEESDTKSNDDDSPRVEAAESRARTVGELQQRLKDLQAKRTPKVSIKDRMLKKGAQDRLKKKKKLLQKREQKKEKMNLEKQQKITKTKSESSEKKPKPVFNSEGKMVFSKFDFSVSGGSKDGTQKNPKDPKKILEKIKSKQERLAKIAESGNIDKVVEIKQKEAWQNALQKAEGIKVKDDPELLKKVIKKKESKKKRSEKEWAAREKNVKKQMDERQRKRQANIDAKKEHKKKDKQKRLIKKGRLIPGF